MYATCLACDFSSLILYLRYKSSCLISVNNPSKLCQPQKHLYYTTIIHFLQDAPAFLIDTIAQCISVQLFFTTLYLARALQ